MGRGSSALAKTRTIAIAGIAIVACYLLLYGAARASHCLVRYESGCVARGNLEGSARDLWDWPYRCSELREYIEPRDDWEIAFAPSIAVEELARAPRRQRPSVCSLPSIPFPSQGLSRPAWCGP